MNQLRASGIKSGVSHDLTAAIGQSKDGGVADGAILIEFAEAMLHGDEARSEAARSAVRDTLGEAGFVDAAAIVSIFEAIDRIADATGMPLPDQFLDASADFREELGINDFRTAGAA